MSEPRINITRTIVHKDMVPYDENWYPSMTLDEAVAYEKNLDVEEALEILEVTDLENITITTEVTVSGIAGDTNPKDGITWDQMS